ncbi:hypothetical protein D3C73_1525590 [compost metagenome]
MLWALKGSLIGWISRRVRLQRNPRIFVVPVFRDELCFSVEAVCAGSLPVASAALTGLKLLRQISAVKGGFVRWSRLLKH